jgi:hypothetical protein
LWFVTTDGVLIWRMALLTTCIYHSELHFTDHWHIQASVLSLLQSLLAVSWQRFLPRQILQRPALRSLVIAARAELLSNDIKTNWVPGWWPFHTNQPPSLLFTGWLPTELLSSLTHQAATSRIFTQLNCSTLSLANQLLHVTSLNWTTELSHQAATSRNFTQLNCWTLSLTNQLLHVTSLNWTTELSHSPTSYFTSLHSTELLNSLTHQPATSRHFTQLNCWTLSLANQLLHVTSFNWTAQLFHSPTSYFT